MHATKLRNPNNIRYGFLRKSACTQMAYRNPGGSGRMRMHDALVATSCRGDLLVVTRTNALSYSHHAFQKLCPVCIPHERLEHTSLCIVRFNHKADAVLLAGRHFLGVASDQRTHNNVLFMLFSRCCFHRAIKLARYALQMSGDWKSSSMITATTDPLPSWMQYFRNNLITTSAQ